MDTHIALETAPPRRGRFPFFEKGVKGNASVIIYFFIFLFITNVSAVTIQTVRDTRGIVAVFAL